MDAANLASAQKICENLVNQVKNSKLNFILNETPYCVNISIKKRFLKEFPMFSAADLQSSHRASTDNSILVRENENLKAQIDKLEAENEANWKNPIPETYIVYKRRII